MLTAEPINNFGGFGTGQTPGEYFFSQGFCRTQFGMTPLWVINKAKDNSALELPTLGLGNFFTQGRISSSSFVEMVDTSGYIYEAQLGLSFALKYLPAPASGTTGNGLFFDQKNRLLYAGNRYLGIRDTSLSDYTTGTVQVTNGSASVVGTGTSFNAGTMVGKRFRVSGTNEFYTVSAVADATHLTLSSNYTGSSASGAGYTIFTSYTDQWKDLVQDITDYRQMDAYEDWVVVPNGPGVALLNVTDDSFNASALTFPSGYKAIAARSGANGVLIGVNFNSVGAVLLWDPTKTRSTAPWIWYNAPVKAVVRDGDTWIVITGRGIYRTNGYSSVEIVTRFPDDRINKASILSGLLPQGAQLVGKQLAVWGTSGASTRIKGGLHLLDVSSGLFEFVPVASGVTSGVSGGAIFFDSNFTTHLSYATSNPAKKVIGSLVNGNPASAFFITEPKGQGGNLKVAEGAKLTLGLNTDQNSPAALSYTLSAKIATLKRNLWNYTQTQAVSTSPGVLKINGTILGTAPKNGDEVTILDGVNAGLVRHIQSIANVGTTNEAWTLDSALPNNTESGVNLELTPFKLVRTYTLSSLNELQDLYFGIQDRPKGRKFLLKFLFENMPSNLELEVQDGQFFYDDKGMEKND